MKSSSAILRRGSLCAHLWMRRARIGLGALGCKVWIVTYPVLGAKRVHWVIT